MISILIPVFNYNLTNILGQIHKQATAANLEFEIICFDDKSDKFCFENKAIIDKLLHSKIIISHENLGRIKARQALADAAAYDWLLFLDADVLPKSDMFIERYLAYTSLNYGAIFGGFAYMPAKPQDDSVLRWKYGKTFEEVDAKKRNLKPYQVIISANFLIKKTVFNSINLKINKKSYGLDNYFAALLQQEKAHVLHINNEVYHLGLENNISYLTKVKESVNTVFWMYSQNRKLDHSNELLHMLITLKKFKLNYVLAFMYRMFKSLFNKNLLGANPSMLLLQLYKLTYICYLDLNK